MKVSVELHAEDALIAIGQDLNLVANRKKNLARAGNRTTAVEPVVILLTYRALPVNV